ACAGGAPAVAVRPAASPVAVTAARTATAVELLAPEVLFDSVAARSAFCCFLASRWAASSSLEESVQDSARAPPTSASRVPSTKPPKLDVGSATMPRMMPATPVRMRLPPPNHVISPQAISRAPMMKVDTPEIVDTWMMMFDTSSERYAGVRITTPPSSISRPAKKGRLRRHWAKLARRWPAAASSPSLLIGASAPVPVVVDRSWVSVFSATGVPPVLAASVAAASAGSPLALCVIWVLQRDLAASGGQLVRGQCGRAHGLPVGEELFGRDSPRPGGGVIGDLARVDADLRLNQRHATGQVGGADDHVFGFHVLAWHEHLELLLSNARHLDRCGHAHVGHAGLGHLDAG